MRYILSAIAAAALMTGVANAETRDLTGFESVSAAGRVEVEIAIGSAYSVELVGPRVERVITRVRGGQLEIETRNEGWRSRSGRDALIRITMPRLNGLDVSAGAEVTARDVSAARFLLDASSGGNVRLDGTCENLTLDVSSGAMVRASDFRCGEVSADASSGANASVFAEAVIDVDASSGASIRWAGPARMRNIDISSGASARRSE